MKTALHASLFRHSEEPLAPSRTNDASFLKITDASINTFIFDAALACDINLVRNEDYEGDRFCAFGNGHESEIWNTSVRLKSAFGLSLIT